MSAKVLLKKRGLGWMVGAVSSLEAPAKYGK